MNPLTPDAPDDGTRNLRRAVAALPPHEPNAATWPRLAAQLAANEALTRAIPTLPPHEPADDLWATLAARLDAGETAIAPEAAAAEIAPVVVRTLPPASRPAWLSPPARRALALAASVLLVLGIWWGLRPATMPTATALHETVTYSEEVSAVASPRVLGALPLAAPDPLGQQGRAFIDAHCSSLPTVCQSGEFRSLRSQLTELETEEARLRQDTRRFGTSPELLREQTRLITLKASITRELVQLLIS